MHDEEGSVSDEDDLTPRQSPLDLGKEKKSHWVDQCSKCTFNSRRFPITSENDLYRLASCQHNHYDAEKRSSSAIFHRDTQEQNPEVYSPKFSPPKLTGTLNSSAIKGIIRPIAFKPTEGNKGIYNSGFMKQFKTFQKLRSGRKGQETLEGCDEPPILRLGGSLSSINATLSNTYNESGLQSDLAMYRPSRQQTEKINSALRQELNGLRAQLEDVEWAMYNRGGEMALLRAQLKDSQEECHKLIHLENYNRDLTTDMSILKANLADLSSQLRQRDQENFVNKQKIIEQEKHNKMLEEENIALLKNLKDLELQYSIESSNWKIEKNNWKEEQRQVLRYQKALQHNYLISCQRAQNLANQIEKMTQISIEAPLKKTFLESDTTQEL